ncbi:MAG: hypothetical protein KFB96_02920 [Thiocapsa sp.]|uniref:hypothetical protein n=1 Tax=Thiocapsa sp. TaxID=2024551 RepID=UPI001BCD6510|nr:hypothetical protein [Thiocapsa sp.]QVL49488.1 MAG: hypothetical protein KFB96_02920 [Thiocapsa sp.]
MTDPEICEAQLVSFCIKDLEEKTRREEISRELHGARWRMMVSPGYKTGSAFGFLNHPAFPDNVFFHVKVLGEWAKDDSVKPWTVLEVEVTQDFNAKKKQWGFAVERAQKISTPSELEMSLNQLRCFCSSPESEDAIERKRLTTACLALDSACQAKIDEAIALGRHDKALLGKFYAIGKRSGPSYREAKGFIEAFEEISERRPDLASKARFNAEKGATAAARGSEAAQRKRQGQPISSIRAPKSARQDANKPLPVLGRTELPQESLQELHPHDLRALSQQPDWQLLIDETGSSFGPEANHLADTDRALGRFVGLLLPKQGARLAPLPPGWHAVDQSIGEIDRVVQAILDVPVGVLGITVQQLPEAPGERWAFGVIRLLDLVLRLMPVDGATRLEVLIEQRGADFKGGTQWPAVAEQARLRLAEAYPERARLIELKIRTITKQDSPYNGYVDALAFISSRASEHSRACLKASGLAGTCLLDGDAEILGRALEWMHRSRSLDGRDWTALLSHPDAGQPSSLVNTLLERLGHAAQDDPALWRRYLEHVTGHFDSRSLDLPVLGQQVIWLDRWKSVDQALPSTLRLLWLTAQLGRSNHLGQTEQPWIEEMRALADQLVDEDARLVCRAELNLAVTATNSYDFAQAKRALQRWNPSATTFNGLHGLMQNPIGASMQASGGVSSPKATAGLRYWGQVRSSIGQHIAFLNDPAGAIPYFDEALESFQRLSDQEAARREIGQTQTYRAIALMDDPAQDALSVCAAVESVTGPMPAALKTLAASVATADKYAHHLALRWLVHRPDPSMAQQYLAQRAAWDQAEGHPWPLIQLYRGLLLYPEDAEAARELAIAGALLAFTEESGPVVRLIGACCRTIAAGWGEPWEAAEPVLNDLTEELPLAKERIRLLRSALTQPTDPLDLLRAVLPFNFR